MITENNMLADLTEAVEAAESVIDHGGYEEIRQSLVEVMQFEMLDAHHAETITWAFLDAIEREDMAEMALHWLDEATKRFPGSAFLKYASGYFYYCFGVVKRAAQCVQEALNLDKTVRNDYYWPPLAALMLLANGQQQEAIQILQEVKYPVTYDFHTPFVREILAWNPEVTQSLECLQRQLLKENGRSLNDLWWSARHEERRLQKAGCSWYMYARGFYHPEWFRGLEDGRNTQ